MTQEMDMSSLESKKWRTRVVWCIAGLSGLAVSGFTENASAQVRASEANTFRHSAVTLASSAVTSPSQLSLRTELVYRRPHGYRTRGASPLAISFLEYALDPRDHAFSLLRLCVSTGTRRGYGLFLNAHY